MGAGWVVRHGGEQLYIASCGAWYVMSAVWARRVGDVHVISTSLLMSSRPAGEIWYHGTQKFSQRALVKEPFPNRAWNLDFYQCSLICTLFVLILSRKLVYNPRAYLHDAWNKHHADEKKSFSWFVSQFVTKLWLNLLCKCPYNGPVLPPAG